ncbi:hypothetical protein CYMTET_29265, partial [Cymbomonas tetramitiformis]
IFVVLAGELAMTKRGRKERVVLREGAGFHKGGKAAGDAEVASAKVNSEVLVLLSLRLAEDDSDHRQKEEASQRALEDRELRKRELKSLVGQVRDWEVRLGLRMPFSAKRSWRAFRHAIRAGMLSGKGATKGNVENLVRPPVMDMALSTDEEIKLLTEKVAAHSKEGTERLEQLARYVEQWETYGSPPPPPGRASYLLPTETYDLSYVRFAVICEWLLEMRTSVLLSIRWKDDEIKRLCKKLERPLGEIEAKQAELEELGVTAIAVKARETKIAHLQTYFEPLVEDQQRKLIFLWDQLKVPQQERDPFLVKPESRGAVTTEATLDMCTAEIATLRRIRDFANLQGVDKKAAKPRGSEDQALSSPAMQDWMARQQAALLQCMECWGAMQKGRSTEEYKRVVMLAASPAGIHELEVIAAALSAEWALMREEMEQRRLEDLQAVITNTVDGWVVFRDLRKYLQSQRCRLGDLLNEADRSNAKELHRNDVSKMLIRREIHHNEANVDMFCDMLGFPDVPKASITKILQSYKQLEKNEVKKSEISAEAKRQLEQRDIASKFYEAENNSIVFINWLKTVGRKKQSTIETCE